MYLAGLGGVGGAAWLLGFFNAPDGADPAFLGVYAGLDKGDQFVGGVASSAGVTGAAGNPGVGGLVCPFWFIPRADEVV
jgi:hypothetical protein